MTKLIRTVILLSGTIIFALLPTGCGKSSDQAKKNTDNSEVKAPSSKDYESPVTVVEAFYREVKAGNLEFAVEHYVKDGKQIVEELKESGRLADLKEMTSSFDYQIIDNKMDEEYLAHVTVKIILDDDTEKEDHKVVRVSGKWLLDNRFIQ